MAEKGNIERLYRIERDASGEEIKRTLANPITHAQAVIMDDGRTLSESMSTGKVEVDIRLSDSGELEYLNGDEWVVAGKETEVYNKDFVATEGQNEFKVDKGIGEKSNLLNVYVNGLKQAEGFAKFIDAQTLKTSVKLNAGDYLNVQYFQVAGGKIAGIPNVTKDNDGLMPKEVFSRLGDLNELEIGEDTTLVESINTINKKAESMTESLMFTEDFTKDKIKGDTTSLSQSVKLSSATTDIFINGIRQPFNIIEPLPGGKFKLIPELKEDDVLTIRYVAPKDIVDIETTVIGDLGSLKTTDKSNIVNAVNEVKESSDKANDRISNLDTKVTGELNNLKQSVSDGKEKVAVAITDKGIKTATDATFDTMAQNISDITTDPSKGTTDAVAGDLLEGKKMVSQGELMTGVMSNNGVLSKTITTQNGKQIITPGYYSGGEIKAQFNNLVPENIKKEVNIGGVTGTHEQLLLTDIYGWDNKVTTRTIDEVVDGNYFTIGEVMEGEKKEFHFIGGIEILSAGRDDIALTLGIGPLYNNSKNTFPKDDIIRSFTIVIEKYPFGSKITEGSMGVAIVNKDDKVETMGVQLFKSSSINEVTLIFLGAMKFRVRGTIIESRLAMSDS